MSRDYAHARAARANMFGFGAGWHSHVIGLAAHLSGLPSPDREALYERLRGPYAARLAV